MQFSSHSAQPRGWWFGSLGREAIGIIKCGICMCIPSTRTYTYTYICIVDKQARVGCTAERERAEEIERCAGLKGPDWISQWSLFHLWGRKLLTHLPSQKKGDTVCRPFQRRQTFKPYHGFFC